jgi:thioredoxin reductase (NADPH)
VYINARAFLIIYTALRLPVRELDRRKIATKKKHRYFYRKNKNTMRSEKEKVRCLILGSGPAGYTAAIYASRANLNPVLYEGIQPGGQLTITTEVENFPGYPQGTTGTELMDDLKKQAARFGTDIRAGIATAADLSASPYRITIDGEKTVDAETLIIATGATARYLGLADEQKYAGMGVSACATCDGFFYRKKTVAVVGGGDTACEEALYLSSLAAKVYLIVRKDHLRASGVMQQRVQATPNIQLLFEHNAVGLYGENGVEGVHLLRRKGEPDEQKLSIPIDGFFLAIGHTPNSGIFKEWLDTDEAGYIKTLPGVPCTRLPGVFAAGDVADPHYRQAITAAASGCMAAMEADRYLLAK